MGLSADDRAAVAELLTEHPDWSDSQVRAEAGLAPTALFSVRAVRRQLGIAPAPGDGQPGRKPGGKGKRKTASAAESETLDESDAGDPTGPKRTGVKRPQSMLAPVLPRLAQAIAQGVISGTNTLTAGAAPMTRQEAAAIAIPSVRILDRTAAKYIKKSGKVTPNQEDAALIALTVIVWAIGWIVASIQGKPRGDKLQVTRTPDTDQAAELFGESFAGPPSAQETVTHSPAITQPVSMGRPALSANAPDADLFAGSEPAATVAGERQAVAVQNGRPSGVSEATWQAVMPTDLGEGLVN